MHTIAYAFPNVKIVTSAVDPEINEKFHVLPGMGNFGDRWQCQSFRPWSKEPKLLTGAGAVI